MQTAERADRAHPAWMSCSRAMVPPDPKELGRGPHATAGVLCIETVLGGLGLRRCPWARWSQSVALRAVAVWKVWIVEPGDVALLEGHILGPFYHARCF